MHRSLRATVAAVSITAAIVSGAATATAEPAVPAPVTLQPIDVTTGGSSAGSAELAIQDIIKDPKWLLLPFILGLCGIGGSVSGQQVCFGPAM
ncbi:hypothetical protein OHB26_18175 [Nocardia sp. NBC_01503]|uniref:hypothetical protein n=1 Tax=Nocardia sp. NBC_01503 TaxID=2975997 RepID=UPI002E7BD4B9|nr:hypothetical protein [Nocardia sp. NBC_01503]WTL35954.1 hypothetical protein OHB26_18175 [Nocardia sp. NBC_01503]